MLRYSEVIGLPVICAATGKKAGVIKILFFVLKTKKLQLLKLKRTAVKSKKGSAKGRCIKPGQRCNDN